MLTSGGDGTCFLWQGAAEVSWVFGIEKEPWDDV